MFKFFLNACEFKKRKVLIIDFVQNFDELNLNLLLQF